MSYETDSAHLDLVSAYRRVDEIVDDLAVAKNITVVAAITVDAIASDGRPKGFTVVLCTNKGEAIVRVHHETFTEEDSVFRTIVVPQLESAIDKLTSK
jgi:hypothetical protein